MEFDHYIVVPGDTLSRIAKKNDTDVAELARINHIREPNYIRAGQSLKIPRKSVRREDEDFYNEIWVRFVDALGNPIAKLKARIVTADGEYQCTTDDIGLLPPVRTTSKDDKPKVFVDKLGGGEKRIAEISAPPGTHQFTLRSPKVKLETKLRPHNGIPDHSTVKPLKLEPGQVQNTRDINGHPVINIGTECPNRDNLRLGLNNKYREHILAASKRSGILPQGIAAMIEAEAAKISVVKEKSAKNKDGSPTIKRVKIRTTEWDPTVVNGIGATGLTQFLPDAWTDVQNMSSSFLAQKIKDLNVRNFPKKLSSNEILELRKDAECSIYSAGDYAVLNLSRLADRGFNVSAVGDMNKAKLAYFAHHEGVGGASRIIRGTLTDQKAELNLAQQFFIKDKTDGRAEAEAYMKKVGLRGAAAYKKFIFDYVDKKIHCDFFICDSSKVDKPLTITEILSKLTALK